MPGSVHALLIGIDAYPQRPLYGCVNDVNGIEAWLLATAGVERAAIRKLIAPHDRTVSDDQLPTLSNICRALTDLAGERVHQGERVFIYYSGHGVRHVSDQPNGRRFAREALLPSDAWRDDGAMQLLFDAELNQFLSAISERGAYLTCVFDCCHSGGVTRGASSDALDSGNWAVRGFELGQVHVSNAPGPSQAAIARLRDGWSVVMACEAYESSRESSLDERSARQGVLTRALLGALGNLTTEDVSKALWSDIWGSVLETVATHNPYQHPRPLGAWSRPILGGPPTDGDRGIPIVARPDGIYEVAAGAISGLAIGSQLAVYGAEPSTFRQLGSPEDLADRVGSVEVTKLLKGSAIARVSSGNPFDELPPRARARLLSLVEPMRLRLQPGDSLAQAALLELTMVSACPPDARPEAWLDVINDSERMLGDDLYNASDEAAPRGLIRLRRATSGRVRALLEHYCRYSEPLRMARRCRDLPGSLTIEILDCNDARFSSLRADSLQHPELPLVGTTVAGFPRLQPEQRFCLRVWNSSSRELSVGLLCCTIDGRVEFLGQQPVPAAGQAVWWQGDSLGAPWTATLGDDRTAAYERLVAIGTTIPGYTFDHLALGRSFADALDAEDGRSALRGQDERLVSPAPAPAPPAPERWTGTILEILVQR